MMKRQKCLEYKRERRGSKNETQIMQKRVKFDFEISFTNGGSIKGEDFRLDISGDDISDKELTDYIVEDLRLLMVGQTKILNKVIFEEQHKRKPINENEKREQKFLLSGNNDL